MNDKKTKVVSKHSYRWWGYLANIVHYSVPVIYTILAYDLFTKATSSLKINGYGLLTILLLVAFGKNFGSMLLEDINKHLSTTFKRLFPSMVYVVIVVLLFLSQFWVKHLIGFLISIIIGRLLALYPYYKYDKNKEYYDRMYNLKRNKEDELAIDEGRIKIK